MYVVTKLGLLFVYDLETATAVYRNRISPDPIFLACDAPSVGGFYALNRRGQVLLATVNEQTIIPFISGQVGGWVGWLAGMVAGWLAGQAKMLAEVHSSGQTLALCCDSSSLTFIS